MFGRPKVPEVKPAEAARLLEEGAWLLDVREQDEWEDARIPGAHHIPLGALPSRLDEVPRDRPVVVQCRSGNRSARATRVLLDAGVAESRNLAGGILAWAREGRPVER